MHRARLGLTADESRRFPAEFNGNPEIHFISIPSSQVASHGNFHEIMRDWAPPAPRPDLTVVPIHEGQWKSIRSLFPDAIKLPDVKLAKAQTSVSSWSELAFLFCFVLFCFVFLFREPFFQPFSAAICSSSRLVV
jgi:hypothetical protein